MPTLAIKSGTTAIAGSTVKGSFSYFSGSTKDLGPTSSTGFYSGVDAPNNGYTVYQIGGSGGWTARVATSSSQLNSILISAGGTGSTVDQNITWATNINSIYINSGATITYTVGQSALGGTIAYILVSGDTGYVDGEQHGLVATTSNISSGAAWGCSNTSISTSSAIGTGNQNTINIMDGCATAGIAARLCGDLVQGGYSDWYLPSLNELNTLWVNRSAIGGFTSVYFWCSTESNSTQAWTQNFSSLGFTSLSNKTSSCYVRAIRSF